MILLIIKNLVALFLWMEYCCFEGVKEGYYYDAVDPDDPQVNLHPFFTFQRAIVAFFVVFFCEPWYIMAPVLPLVFSFIHNGSYCCKRNDLNPETYPARWKAESSTSRAIFDFSYSSRLAQFIIGLAAYFIGMAFYICYNS